MISWAKNQPWWTAVWPLLERGLHVALHVQDMPPGHLCSADGSATMDGPKGTTLYIQRCPVGSWHIALAAPVEFREEALRQLRSKAMTANHTAEA